MFASEKTAFARAANSLRSEVANSRLLPAMKELVEAIAKALADYPNRVHVRPVEAEYVTVFELRVDPDDVRRIIGRQGRTINAIRTILNAVGVKLHGRFALEILD